MLLDVDVREKQGTDFFTGGSIIMDYDSCFDMKQQCKVQTS